MKNIAILLATYNGKKWVKEQIDSILNQKDVEVSIFISDDLSTDGTLEYLKDLYINEKRIFFLESTEKFGDAAKNFYRLIKDVDFTNFDYIALADQDDIWLEDKLIRAVRTLEKKHFDGYSSNVLAFWEDGRKKLINKSQKQNKFDYLFEAAGPGCTYVLTQKLAENFQKFLKENFEQLNKIALHDWLIYAFSRENNYKWFIDDFASLKYRQHSSNQVGVNSGFKAILKRVKMVFFSWYRMETTKIINVLSLEKKYGFSKLVLNKSYFNNLSLLRYVLFFRRKFRDRVVLFFLILFGLY